MKKIFGLLFTLLFVMFLSVNPTQAQESSDFYFEFDDGTTILSEILPDGSKEIEIPIPNNGPRATVIGNASFRISNDTRVLTHTITMRPGHVFGTFLGRIQITSLTSGLSHGAPTLLGRTGVTPMPRFRGHDFLGRVSGTVTSSAGISQVFPSGSLRWISQG